MDEETITLTGKDLRRLRSIETALAGRITNRLGAIGHDPQGPGQTIESQTVR